MRRTTLSLMLATTLLAAACGKDAPKAPDPPAAPATPAPSATAQPHPQAPAAEAAVSERWSGQVQLPDGQPLSFTVQLRAEPGQPATGVIDIPAQGVQAMALRDVDLSGDTRAFTLPTPGPEAGWARFSTRRESPGVATGTLTQGPATLPVTLRALEDGELPADAPPQTPRPPYPYEAREVTVTNPNDGVTLAGTLTMPQGDGPHPAVLLLTGSGPQDRDETLFGHKPFLVLADHLTRKGVAVLRLDDRGVGGSQGDLAETPLEVLTADARVAVSFLRSQPGIASERVGLLGHSEGGAVALIAAAGMSDVAFVVTLAGPGVAGRQMLSGQLEALLRSQGAAQATIDKHLALQGAVLDAVAQGKDEPTLRAAVAALVEAQIADAPTPTEVPEAVREELIDAHTAAVNSPAFRSLAIHDPAPVLAQLRQPLLALFGSKDLQVLAQPNAEAMRKALKAAEHPDFTVEVIEGANHLFQTAETGGVDEYARLKETLKPEVLDKVADWIIERAERRVAPPDDPPTPADTP